MDRLMRRAQRLEPTVATQVGRQTFSSDTINTFYESKALNEEIKKGHRETIAGFFNGCFEKTGKNPRCFSMPGKHWKMEQLLADCRTRKKQVKWMFVAAERQLSVVEFGMRYMPRFGQHAVFSPDSSLVVASTDRSRVANCSVLHLMDRIKNCEKIQYEFGSWSAFWWDMQGPLSTELAHMAARLEFCLCKNRDRFPFAVTIMNGRDHIQSGDSDSLELRAELLCRQMKTHKLRVELNQCEKYQSANGAPMGLILGMIYRF